LMAVNPCIWGWQGGGWCGVKVIKKPKSQTWLGVEVQQLIGEGEAGPLAC